MAQNTKNNKAKQPKQSVGGRKGIHSKIVLNQKKKQATEEKKRCSCALWTLGFLALIVPIACLLIHDTNVNGNGVFAKSMVGKALENAGMLPHVEKAWYTTMRFSARSYQYMKKTVPVYATPAIKLSCDVYKIVRNSLANLWEYMVSKLPAAAAFVEQYFPGFPDIIGNATVTVMDTCNLALNKSATYLKNKVFIGQLSPENMMIALNSTTNKALEYYNTFEKKVDFYAKLK